MTITTSTLKSRVDGLPLSLLEVIPDGEIRGVIQLVHGKCEYKERYQPFMEYMASKGFACMIHDHRGHGHSVRSQNDLGYMYGTGAEGVIEDMRLVNACLRQRFAGLPVIMLGHSMGSLAVRAYMKKYDRSVRLVILSGSPARNRLLPIGKAIARVQKFLQGDRHKCRLLNVLSFGSYGARFPGEKDPHCWICSDPKVVSEAEASSLFGFPFTADAYLTLFELMEEAYSLSGWKCARPKLPILFISGGDDPCTGNVRQFKDAIDRMRMVGYCRVRGKIYPGMRHEVLNEIGKEQVWHDLYLYIVKELGLYQECR